MDTEAVGPQQIRAAFTTAIHTADDHSDDLAAIAAVLADAADRYHNHGMAASTVAHIREAAAAVTAAATQVDAAGEWLEAALDDFDGRDGAVGDAVAEAGNLAATPILVDTGESTVTNTDQPAGCAPAVAQRASDAATPVAAHAGQAAGAFPEAGESVDIGPGGLFLGDVNAGAVSWSGKGPAGGRVVQVDNGTDLAEIGLTRPQMRQLRDALAASLDPAAAPPRGNAITTDAASVSWQPDGPERTRLRVDDAGQSAEVVLTAAQMRAIQQQITTDLAAEDAAAATFAGVTGRLADKYAGQTFDTDSQLALPDGALTDEQAAACGRAVRLYRNSTYRAIAAYLRGDDDKTLQIRELPGQEPSPEPASQHVAQIDQAMRAAPLDEPIEVWRGVHDLPVVLGAQLADDMTGTQWTERSFPSTSADPTIASLFADDVLLRLHVPAGVGAIQLDSRPTSREPHREAEVLLQRGLQMRVVGDGHEAVGGGGVTFAGGQMQTAPPRQYRVLDVEVTVPEQPSPRPETGARPAGLPRSTEPIRPPNNGADQGLMHFDSALGQLWNQLGEDRHLEVDGHALGNVITDLGEGITRRHHDTNQALEELRRIRVRLPDGAAAQHVDAALDRLDAPQRSAPALPDNAPEQLKTLMNDLNGINLVRRGYDISSGADSFHETDRLAELTERWMRREISPMRFEQELRGLARLRHESSEGWTEIGDAVVRALRDFRQWRRPPT